MKEYEPIMGTCRSLLLACAVMLSLPAGSGSETIAGFRDFELIESAPIETSLDHDWMRNTPDIWLEMMGRAGRSLEVAAFYTSSEPEEALEPIIRAIERAAARGVRVRYLGEDKFYETYPQTLDRLSRHEGIEVRRLPTAGIMGGVMHAKYFIVDREELYVGSANFDWRALDHIQELGVRIRDRDAAAAFAEVFDLDWEIAGGSEPAEAIARRRESTVWKAPIVMSLGPSETIRVTPVFSPTGWLPHEQSWDEPHLVSVIDGARREVDLQLLTYRPVTRDGDYYGTLEQALRRAAARGVNVRLLLADWCKRASTISYIKSLALIPNITVKLVTIPEGSGGFIPYARVVHAKYLAVDGSRGWIGTSNWEREYFYASRNAGVMFENATIGGLLARFFGSLWESDYAYEVRPEVDYAVPRIGE